MKRILLSVFVGIGAVLCACSADKGDAGNVIPFADPFIYYEDGTYYLYGTGSEDGIAVATSKDLKTWTWPEEKPMYLALHKDDSYGDFWFWAPEVYRVGEKYLMYYSSEEHICVAEGDSPLGPFRQKEQKPMREAKGIDNSLFIDKDGKPYLFWVNFTESGLQSWVAELEEDCSTIIEGSEKLCIATSQEWEKVWPSVNEGPFVLEHEGYYYLTYSANSYESPNYGLGYAVAEHPAGPWVKYEGNPIFQFAGGLEGVGHHAYFIDRKGNRRIAFHSHCEPGKIHPRKIHIGKYGFKEVKDGPDLLVIDEEFITPTMKIM